MGTPTHSQPQSTASNWSPPANRLEPQHTIASERQAQGGGGQLQTRPFVVSALSTPPNPPNSLQAKAEQSRESFIDLTKLDLFGSGAPSGPPASVSEGDRPTGHGAVNVGIQRQCATCAAEASDQETPLQPKAASAAPTLQSFMVAANSGVQRQSILQKSAPGAYTPNPRDIDLTQIPLFTSAAGASNNPPSLQRQSLPGAGVASDGVEAELQAKAFTTEQDIYFKQGAFKPGSQGGQALLAHDELTHVVPQTGGIRAKVKPNKVQMKLARSPQSDLPTNSYVQLKQDSEEASKTTADIDKAQLEQKQLVTETAESQSDEPSVSSSQTATVDPASGPGKHLAQATPSSNGPESTVASPEQSTNSSVKTAGDNPESLPTAGEAANVPSPEAAQPSSLSGATAVSGGLGGGVGGAAEAGAASAPAAASLNTEDPGQIIEQLATTLPTQLPATHAQAGTASTQALENQRQQLQESLPEVPAPTGLSAATATEEKPGQAAQKVAEQAASSGQEPAMALEGSGAEEVSTAEQIQVPEAPAALPQPPTQLAGGDGQAEGSSDNALSQSAQRALSSINASTSQISTSLGDRPQVDLTGDADPSQMETAKATSTQEVQSAKGNAAQAISQDFGENAIYPQASDEILKPNKALAATTPGAAQAQEGTAGVPGEVAGSLDQSLAPYLREQIGPEQEKYQSGKEKFDTDTTQARTKANEDIAALNEETRQEQLQEQQTAQAEVAQAKQEWRDELDAVEQDYQDKASKATTDQRQKIDDEKAKGDSEAAKHIAEAEQKAESEKQKADQEATKKKAEGKKESGGFLGWVKSKAKAFIDGIKSAVNFIYDNLRKAVKAIFEAAKKLAVAAIELARKAITTLIKGLGEILKGLVKVAFAAFPGIAKRINAKIDQAVNKAVELVNKAADALKKGVTAILDFLANTLDAALKLIQDIYNGALTVIGMLVNGELAELLEKIGNLVEAAKAAPPQFETAAYEELLGGNLDEPLSPAELAQAGVTPPGSEGESTSQDGAATELPSPPWTTDNVGVDAVDNNMELSPELSAELMQQTNGEGEVMLGESNDESRSMESILAEAAGPQAENAQSQTAEGEQKQTYPDDGLTPQRRAEIKWQLMKAGIAKWWSENWPTVILGATAAIGGFIALNVVTGGAVTAALPAIMGVVGPLFAGLTVLQLAGHVRDYLAKGWEGDTQGGGKSLAKGLAAGAIELISWLTFKVGSAALKGAKAAAKGAKEVAKGGVTLAKKATQAVIKGAKYVIQKGKVLFKGIAKSDIGKQFKKLKDLGEGLLERMRFKAFRIRVANRRFKLEGLINPWVDIADGRIREVPQGTRGAIEVTDGDLLELRRPGEKVLPTRRGYEQARNKALEFLGDLGPDAQPLIGRLKASAGHNKTVGFQSADGRLRLRLDFDPKKGPHFNFEDFRHGKGSNAVKIALPFEGNERAFRSYLKLLNKWGVF